MGSPPLGQTVDVGPGTERHACLWQPLNAAYTHLMRSHRRACTSATTPTTTTTTHHQYHRRRRCYYYYHCCCCSSSYYYYYFRGGVGGKSVYLVGAVPPPALTPLGSAILTCRAQCITVTVQGVGAEQIRCKSTVYR